MWMAVEPLLSFNTTRLSVIIMRSLVFRNANIFLVGLCNDLPHIAHLISILQNRIQWEQTSKQTSAKAVERQSRPLMFPAHPDPIPPALVNALGAFAVDRSVKLLTMELNAEMSAGDPQTFQRQRTLM